MRTSSDKFDLLTRRMLERLPDDRPEQFFILTAAPIGAAERKQLEDVGVSIESIVGDMLTSTCKVKDVARVADLDFVTSVEVSGPLFSES